MREQKVGGFDVRRYVFKHAFEAIYNQLGKEKKADSLGKDTYVSKPTFPWKGKVVAIDLRCPYNSVPIFVFGF